jgi:hypothetical protein
MLLQILQFVAQEENHLFLMLRSDAHRTGALGTQTVLNEAGSPDESSTSSAKCHMVESP